MGVPANGDRLCPTRDQARNVLADDWFSEDCPAQNIPDGAVRAFPHFLQLEFWDNRREKKQKKTEPRVRAHFHGSRIGPHGTRHPFILIRLEPYEGS